MGKPTRVTEQYTGYRSSFDARGYEVERMFVDEAGNHVRTTSGHAGYRQTFDARGNRTEVQYLDDSKRPIWSYRSTFDRHGNEVPRRVFDEAGKQYASHRSVLDPVGNPTSLDASPGSRPAPAGSPAAGTGSMTSGSGLELSRVAAVSDEIRHLSLQAFLMQLHATNAMVATKSQGAHVPGFEVVSDQMRQLSRELVGCLHRLRVVTVRWLGVVSHNVAAARSIAILERSAGVGAASARMIKPVLAKIRADDRLASAGVAAHRAFISVLDDARQLAATGCVLARSAKLEATRGGALAAKLAESAAEFTERADSVDESVRAIARRMK